MGEERLDCAVLISLSMREEAEVMASALRAEGIDAFVGNANHANVDWGWTLALGGMQVFVPRAKIQEAKDAIRVRIKEAAEHPEGESVGRRDRWKLWAVIGFSLGLPALAGLVAMWLPANDTYDPPAPAMTPTERELPTYFAAPDNLTEVEQRAVLRDYCRDNKSESVISREDGVGYITPCVDLLRVN